MNNNDLVWRWRLSRWSVKKVLWWESVNWRRSDQLGDQLFWSRGFLIRQFPWKDILILRDCGLVCWSLTWTWSTHSLSCTGKKMIISFSTNHSMKEAIPHKRHIENPKVGTCKQLFLFWFQVLVSCVSHKAWQCYVSHTLKNNILCNTKSHSWRLCNTKVTEAETDIHTHTEKLLVLRLVAAI